MGNSQQPLLKPQLVALFVITLTQGMGDGFLGPSLKDLQCMYDVDTKTISLLFPVYAGSKLLGCFAFFYTLGCINDYLQLTGSSVVAGVLISILPVLSTFWIAVMIIAVIGFFLGLMNSIGNTKSGQFSKDSVLPYHLWCFGFTSGNITAPLILYPFLGPHEDSNGNNASYRGRNITDFQGVFTNGTVIPPEVCTTSHLKDGLLVVSGPFILAAFGFLALAIALKTKDKPIKTHEVTAKSQTTGSYWHNGWATFSFITASLVTMTLSGTTNVAYANLLPTFGIHSDLQENPSTMALMTSAFSAVTLFGRFLSIIFSYSISQRTLFLSSLMGVLGSSVLLLFVGHSSAVGLWVGALLLALFYAPVFGSLLGWSEHVIPLSSSYLILTAVLDNVGLSVSSLIIGQLMAIYSANMLHFSFVFIGVLQVVGFLIMFILTKYIPRDTNGYSDLDIDQN